MFLWDWFSGILSALGKLILPMKSSFLLEYSVDFKIIGDSSYSLDYIKW